ncbi:MAG: hypothetical protein BM557_02135 [Flavobacterium sp. MedPE-SWcel]|uniref:hypothetical protein n=1 Tax=uncultured Flavobacterium sp. TaxID=165435 RepID=UPI00091EB8D4|nr:hypothetical protein [uncultured Flavobacterium sp.]OIQ22197.1 MAG: hypothetical protein BM557_02135 [Flavobacterium sp. MedPE-SWcel]
MSGVTADLNNKGTTIDTGNDSIVIIANLENIPGGKTLDTTGFSPEVIPAGHLVIEETATGKLKPMPVSGDNYGSLPASHTYKGVVVSSVSTKKPFVSILVRGSVNKNASKYGITSILSAVKTALPLIRFTQD